MPPEGINPLVVHSYMLLAHQYGRVLGQTCVVKHMVAEFIRDDFRAILVTIEFLVHPNCLNVDRFKFLFDRLTIIARVSNTSIKT